jgi:hypothetical protein
LEKYIIHLNAPRMSGRVVEFRILGPDEIARLERNGAVEAGDAATRDELRAAQLRQFVSAMIVRYTKGKVEPVRVKAPAKLLKKGMDPEQLFVDGGVPDPESLKGATWVTADAATMATQFGTIFSAKESEALRMQYTDYHELTGLEVMMLSGKAQPAPTGD